MDFTDEPSDEVIAEFWANWQGIRADVAQAIVEFRIEEYGPLLNVVVKTMHPGLVFGVQAGLTARHALAFSVGTPDAEQAVRRLLAAAPPADEHWEYTDLLAGTADVREIVFICGDIEVRMRDARAQVVVLEERPAVVVVLYHPMWDGMDEDLAADLTQRAVEAACPDVPESWQVLWLVALDEPEDSMDLAEVRVRVDQLMGQAG